MELRPSEIRFSQDSINNVFDKMSGHAGKRIGETLDDLLRGVCNTLTIPTITVVNINGVWYSADNRRLWVFRKLEELGKCTTIPVCEGYSIPSQKFTTNNNGISVRVRGDAGGSYWRKKYGRDSSQSLNNPSGYGTQSLNKPRRNTASSLVSSVACRDEEPFTRSSSFSTDRRKYLSTSAARTSSTTFYLRPGRIRFSKESIASVFNKSTIHGGEKIGETLDELLIGLCSVTDIPTITVVRKNDHWFTVNNKRLWVFRKLEQLGRCARVLVKQGYEIPDGTFTTENNGRSIRVRHDEGGCHWKVYKPDSSVPDDRRSGSRQRSAPPITMKRPSKIRFSGESIRSVFSSSSEHAGKKIGDTLDELILGKCSILNIPTITIFRKDGAWYTVNNRRLWVFRKLEELGECEKIPVKKVDTFSERQFTTKNKGRSVTVRSDEGGLYWKFKKLSLY